MNAPYWFGLRDRHLRDAAYATWDRLPVNVQLGLAHVELVEQSAIKAGDGSNGWGSAGEADVWLRPGAPTTDAQIGIVAHELAHVYCGHYRALNAGTKSRDQCEAEADATAARWGFVAELRERRMLIGR